MISLDKIKIVAPLKAVTIVDESKFEVRVKRGVEASKSYTQTTPFLLYVEVDYEKGGDFGAKTPRKPMIISE